MTNRGAVGKGEASTGQIHYVGGAGGVGGASAARVVYDRVGGGGAGGGGHYSTPIQVPEPANIYEAAERFMRFAGLEPTPDAVRQMSQAFLPCLKIMCERPWNPDGETWRKSGRMGILTDIRKKFERLWERGWLMGQRHDDSVLDLINYLGMYIRADKSHWGEWGNPAPDPEE